MGPFLKRNRVYVLRALICLLPLSLTAQSVTVAKRSFTGRSSSWHADSNSDGREDLVFSGGSAHGGFFVQLSTGNGVYAAPSAYGMPNGVFASAVAIGDFNSDAKADLAVFASDGNMYEYLNNGNGTFHEQAEFVINSSSEITAAVASDFNHDGRMDIAFVTPASPATLHIWFGNGDGGFTVGPSTTVTNSDYLMLGDFDGDGIADLAIGEVNTYNTVEVLYGDGKGNFPSTSMISRSGDHSIFSAGDANSDGKMDILASPFYPGHTNISVYYGTASRTFTRADVPIAHCVSSDAAPMATDMNGDDINDLVVEESDCSTGASYLDVLTRNSDGTYNSDQVLASTTSSDFFGEPTVLRADRNTKADLAVSQCSSTPPFACTLKVLLNTTSGSFPTCAAPNNFEGIHVCSPGAGSTVASPVTFRVGAAGQTPMRKVEVWVDGHKVVEQLDGFSNYTFMDRKVSFRSGTHQVTIFAAGWDNWLEKTSFTLNIQ